MEQENNQKIYEVQTKLGVASGFKFGLGFGIGFFASGLVIGFILFAIFSGTLIGFFQSVSDPFGIKNNNSQPVPSSQSSPDFLKYLAK
jgi:hypothetical protein